MPRDELISGGLTFMIVLYRFRIVQSARSNCKAFLNDFAETVDVYFLNHNGTAFINSLGK